MRFFRIPNFTGIEGHRDDANRGSLAKVEGCVPQPTGGLRSAPVWTELADLSDQGLSQDKSNKLATVSNDDGDEIAYISRQGSIHDIGLLRNSTGKLKGFTKFNTPVIDGTFDMKNAYFNSVGNRSLVYGDGSKNAKHIGINKEGYEYEPDERLYSMEWRSFPYCKYFVVGPGKALFAAGDCNNPLSVYVSEPANLSNPDVDAPYSDFPVSKVDLLLTNATQITGLSVFKNQVIVHTDKGCSLLYTPKSGQASSGFRTEQTPSSASSGAASHASVTNSDGPMPYWLGFDGQIYKDEGATRSGEEVESESDNDQASYLSKGVWDKDHPDDLSKTFAGYDSSSGTYFIFVENPDYKTWAETNEVFTPEDLPFVCPAPNLYTETDKIITPDGQPAPEPEDPNDGEDPPPPEADDTTYEPPADEPETGNADSAVPCEQAASKSGGIAWPDPDEFEINLGDKCGVVKIQYSPRTVPDRFIFEWNGIEIHDTGWVSDDLQGYLLTIDHGLGYEWADHEKVPAELRGEKVTEVGASGLYVFDKTKSTPSKLKVKAYGPIQGTAWSVTASCADEDCGADTSTCRAGFMGLYGDFLFEPTELIEGTGFTQNITTETKQDVVLGKAAVASLDVIGATEGVEVVLRDGDGIEIYNKTGPFIDINSEGPLDTDGSTPTETFKDANSEEHLGKYGLSYSDITDSTTPMLDWYKQGLDNSRALFADVTCPEEPEETPEAATGLEGLNSALGALVPSPGAFTTQHDWQDEKTMTVEFVTAFYTACGLQEYLADALTIFAQLEAWGVEQKVGSMAPEGNTITNGQLDPVGNAIILNFGPDARPSLCDPDDPNATAWVEKTHGTYMHEAVHVAQDVIDGIGNTTLESVLAAPSQYGMDYWTNNYQPSGDSNHDLMEQEGSTAGNLVDGFQYVQESFTNANGAILSYGSAEWLEYSKTQKCCDNKKNGCTVWRTKI